MATDEFLEGVDEVRGLRNLAASGSIDAIDLNNALLRASVVLLVSHFEAFLKSLAEEFIDRIDSGRVSSKDIPRDLKFAVTMPILEEIVKSSDDVQQERLMEKMQLFSSLWKKSATPPRGTFRAKTLSRVVTSAKKEVINRLFVLMGSTANVCDGDIDIARPDDDMLVLNIEMSLKDVLQCRNDIAHGVSERKPTVDDVSRYVEFLVCFSARLQAKASDLSGRFQND